MPGMRDVARVAQVSLSTVSAVLSDSDKYVSEEIRERVTKAAAEIGYQMLERKKKQDKVIAVALPNITSVFFSNLLSGIVDTVTEEGYTLIFGNSGYDFKKEKQFIQMIQNQSLCGVIIDTVCTAEQERQYLDELKEAFVPKKIPIVLMERKIQDEEIGCVYVDHMDNQYKATRHLIETGHRSIVHIAGKMDNPLALLRLQGYRKALQEAGIPYDSELVQEGNFSPSSGYMAMKRIMDRRSDYTAVAAANDQMAIGAIKAILSVGKKVPEDIAVTGIDNLSIASMVAPSLTTINVPTYQMGRTSVKLLMGAREGNAGNKVELKCNLVIRRSTDQFAGSEWDMFGW